MKKRYLLIPAVILLLSLGLVSVSTALAAEALTDVNAELSEAKTVDEQLQILYDASVRFSKELEAEGWNVSLTRRPAEDLPEDLHPSEETLSAMEKVSVTAEDFTGAKFIAVYNDQGSIELLGDLQIRIPKDMRASSLEEADAVLYLVHKLEERSDYTGSAYNRIYTFYVFRRGGSSYGIAHRNSTTPPIMGKGTLRGKHLSMSFLWKELRPWFYGLIDLTYPEGTASYRIVGESCWLSGLEGDFVRYEIPAEVQGYPVTAVESLSNPTLEELVLPESIEWIGAVSGKKIQTMNFPSTLRRITGYISIKGDIILNEGLEELGAASIEHGNGASFTLPSTLKSIADSTLRSGADCPSLVIPESLSELPNDFIYYPGNLLSVYIPASITRIGEDTLFDTLKSVRIYTPEGSYAAKLAEKSGLDWVACDQPEDMPVPYYGTEGGFEYGIAGDEAILIRYTGEDPFVRIPDTLGGCPVTSIRSRCFSFNSTYHVIFFPKTLRRVDEEITYQCIGLQWKIIDADAAALLPDCFQDKYMGEKWLEWTPDLEEKYSYEPPAVWDETQAETLKTVGAVLTFGQYEQGGNESNGPEPVEWIVLAVEENRSLLISRHVLELDVLDQTTVGYEHSDIRIKLATDIPEKMFSYSQWALIDPCDIKDSNQSHSYTDKLFLLSAEEAKTYFPSDEDRIAVKLNADGEEVPTSWWLRTQEESKYPIVYYMQCVTSNGYIRNQGGRYSTYQGIRPAMWVKTGP